TSLDVQVAARKVLRVLAVEDVGHEAKKWQAWRKKHPGGDRGAWLLAGLLHGDASIAALAGRELARLTGDDLGFSPELPKGERKKIRAAYAERLEAARRS
ncbi:MAG: hypothetical protein AAGH15_12165, partial [Myxococcota bacterium]